MSSNGVMLQDYVPNAINNLTEEIWCAGAVIPAGKRVVIGHMRDGWLEVTFTMGRTQDFIGMALVPPDVIGVEEPQRIPGVGFMPQGVAAMAVRSGRSQQGPSSVYVNALFTSVGGGVFSGEVGGRSVQATFAGTYYNEVQGAQSGKPIGVRGWVQYDAANRQYYGNVTVTIGQHTNVSLYMRAVLEGTIDQSAPLPPANVSNAPVLSQIPNCGPGQELWARGTETSPPYRPFDFQVPVSELQNWLRNNPSLRASTTIFYCRGESTALSHPWPSPVPPPKGGGGGGSGSFQGAVNPVAMPALQLPGVMRGARSARRAGLSAGGASAFTTTAANALNQELVTNSCAGCADMTSRLRQLTFAFKVAVATDQGMPAMNMNMSNMLAMTAYGPATDAALKLVLGAGTAYANGPCTDDAGNCLGNFSTPITPQTIQTVEQQFAQQIQSALGQVAYLPQADIVHTLVQGFVALITQFATELAKMKNVIPVEATPPPKVGGACPQGTTRDANGICVSPPATTAPAGIPWSTIVIGGLIGTTILATGAFVYTHARRS